MNTSYPLSKYLVRCPWVHKSNYREISSFSLIHFQTCKAGNAGMVLKCSRLFVRKPIFLTIHIHGRHNYQRSFRNLMSIHVHDISGAEYTPISLICFKCYWVLYINRCEYIENYRILILNITSLLIYIFILLFSIGSRRRVSPTAKGLRYARAHLSLAIH